MSTDTGGQEDPCGQSMAWVKGMSVSTGDLMLVPCTLILKSCVVQNSTRHGRKCMAEEWTLACLGSRTLNDRQAGQKQTSGAAL